jgi:2-hydroxychromene-2-carboxylate isomerase
MPAAYGSSALAPAARVSAVPGSAAHIREFYFDLACPFSYLAAERVERLLGQVDWIPVSGMAVCGSANPGWELASQAEERARALRLPLSWPECSKDGFPGALRAAAYAAANDVGGRFALAGLRLAFCGGFDLEDSEILAEAAAVSGLSFDACLSATVDQAWDAALAAPARVLAEAGLRRLPAFRIGDRWFEGEPGLLEAVSMLRHASVMNARVTA